MHGRSLLRRNRLTSLRRGEGEGIVRDPAQGLDHLGDIPGITFRSRTGKVVETPARDEIEDLDSLPFPDREGIDINYAASLPLDVPAVIWDSPYTSIVSSRGCSFGCTYCNCPEFSGRKCHVRSGGNVLKESEELTVKGYGAFTFVDDNFLLDPIRVTEMYDGRVALGILFDGPVKSEQNPRRTGSSRNSRRRAATWLCLASKAAHKESSTA
jgi:anaerobic magnesium-protoporphyrin IX monomethyl ester cyclase